MVSVQKNLQALPKAKRRGTIELDVIMSISVSALRVTSEGVTYDGGCDVSVDQ